MKLWNIIRNWFVQHIFGGYWWSENGYWIKERGFMVLPDTTDTSRTTYISSTDFLLNGNMSLGDWLSTTSTIIVLVAICVGFYFLVRWLFRLTAGLIAGRG